MTMFALGPFTGNLLAALTLRLPENIVNTDGKQLSSITQPRSHSVAVSLEAQNLSVPQIISTLAFLPSSGLTPWFLARHRFF